ncbi:YbdD/YjiX family protein [Corynebacterium sp. sy039]|uniref:YbdD/YjiX family protein n=1 Tax=Corynebacterium sp. sy039 TaxID=2599641 RepID=UPI0011B84A15|nr:YbdD/YjiX family protein [Corynebacterium sp. sy039]QDZ43157.1 YbdD/YjiX family protein [Corynebacterium sp. sy039]
MKFTHITGLIRRTWHGLGEMMGEHDYHKYVAHMRAHHPEQPIPSEKQYWQRRWQEQQRNPGSRCC